MNVKARIESIRQLNDELKSEMIANVKEALKEAIPDVTIVSDAPRIFTVKMSTIAADPFLRLCPSQYDIVEQRDAVINAINGLGPEKALDLISDLCLNGKSNSAYVKDVVFHPSVIEKLRSAFEEVYL